MALIVSTNMNYHWVKQISAHTHGGGVLKLTLHGDRSASETSFNEAEINVFTDDVALVGRLIEAINGAAKAPSPAPVACEKCNALTVNPENEYGEFICDDCAQNAAEAAYERHCEAFHDGGSTQFISLQQQQIEARRLK